MALPNDPIMLLSVVNLKLRDFYKTSMLCAKIWMPTRPALRKAPGRGLRVRCPAQPVRVIFPEKAFF